MDSEPRPISESAGRDSIPGSSSAFEFLRMGDRKRPREGGSNFVDKRICEEEMSWWTCLMLGISQDSTKKHPIVARQNETK